MRLVAGNFNSESYYIALKDKVQTAIKGYADGILSEMIKEEKFFNNLSVDDKLLTREARPIEVIEAYRNYLLGYAEIGDVFKELKSHLFMVDLFSKNGVDVYKHSADFHKKCQNFLGVLSGNLFYAPQIGDLLLIDNLGQLLHIDKSGEELLVYVVDINDEYATVLGCDENKWFASLCGEESVEEFMKVITLTDNGSQNTDNIILSQLRPDDETYASTFFKTLRKHNQNWYLPSTSESVNYFQNIMNVLNVSENSEIAYITSTLSSRGYSTIKLSGINGKSVSIEDSENLKGNLMFALQIPILK